MKIVEGFQDSWEIDFVTSGFFGLPMKVMYRIKEDFT